MDRVLKRDTPKGPCWLRYNHDGYGQRADGGPFIGYGQGRPWPLLVGERAHYELAAGLDIRERIATIERFASDGGMLPEQVWDERDAFGLCFGGPAGSAMPLVWAHSEYLKLLRSAADGKVFDCIPIVQERYAQGKHEKSHIEVFKVTRRQIRRIDAGKTLRITAAARFRVIWSDDNWQSNHALDSTQLGFAGSYADLPTTPEQTGALSFTLFWPDENRWEGRNFDVAVEPPA
jgi:glucoamylase